MKKAGIVTLFGNYNYGNKFQNYAVQEILREKGITSPDAEPQSIGQSRG